jgi:hypothetical protein
MFVERVVTVSLFNQEPKEKKEAVPMKHIALLLVLLMVAASADAAVTTILKGIKKGGDLTDYRVIATNIEDEDIRHNMVSMWPNDNPGSGTGGSMVVGPETAWGDNGHYTTLIGIPDIFSLLPSNGIVNPADIISATFRVRHRGPSGGEIIGVHAITSPWLYTGAESAVTALHRVPGGEDPWWAADIGKTLGTDTEGNPTWDDFVGFSAADYDAASGGQFTITDTSRHAAHDIDITQIVRDWLTGGEYANQGLVLVWEYPEAWPYADAPYMNSSEQNSSWDTLPDGSAPGPEFIMTYVPEPVTIGLLAAGALALIRRKR